MTGWAILGAILVALIWSVISLIRSLDRERLEAEQARREADLKERQAAVILEPRTEKDAVDRLNSGTF